MKRDKEEWSRFWIRGGIEHLHARYITHSFAPHTHEGYVFAIVSAGAEAFRYRGAVHCIRPGFVGLLNPGEVHTGHAESEEGWLYRTLYPSLETLSQAALAVFGTSTPPYFPEGVVYDPDLAARLLHYHHLAEGDTLLGREEAFLEFVACAVTRYADGCFQPRVSRRESGAVRQVKAYLEAHLSANVTLDSLAELTGLSPYTLLRAFRRETGLTPHSYQVQRRVEWAKTRLHAGEPIARVAALTGFFDQSHLGRHFKRIVGVTPRSFRGAAISS